MLIGLLSAALSDVVPTASAACVAALVPAALIDARSRRLPDRLLAIAGVLLLVGLSISGAVGNDVDVTGVAAGAAALGGPLLVLHLLSPDSMGFGDVKAAAVLGAAVGVVHWQLSLTALALAAGISATGALLTHARTIPFGPGLVSGATIALVAATVFVPTTEPASATNWPAVTLPVAAAKEST